MPSTVRDLSELTTVDNADMLLISDTSDVLNRDKRISRLNLLGTNISGGGSIAMGNNNVTFPTSGNVVMKTTGQPAVGASVQWVDGNMIGGGGVLLEQMLRRATSPLPVTNQLIAWSDNMNIVKNSGIAITDIAAFSSGTWTPALTFGGSANGMTFNANIGRYIRLGTMVILWATIRLTAKGSSVGVAVIGGMPFVSVNVNLHRPPVNIWGAIMTYTGVLGAINVNSTTEITLQINNNGTQTSCTDTAFGNTSVVYVNFIYETV